MGTVEGASSPPEQVLIVQTLGAPHPERRKARRRPRRAKPVESPPPLPEVAVSRVTVVLSTPFDDPVKAKQWLDETAGDPQARAERAREALDVLNRGLDALREAAEDPLVHPASFHAAIAVRLGYGSGEQLADGHWTEARDLPAAPHARHEDLDAQRRAALQLAGIDPDAVPVEDDGGIGEGA